MIGPRSLQSLVLFVHLFSSQLFPFIRCWVDERLSGHTSPRFSGAMLLQCRYGAGRRSILVRRVVSDFLSQPVGICSLHHSGGGDTQLNQRPRGVLSMRQGPCAVNSEFETGCDAGGL